MTTPTILLVDNGSSRAESTRSLRRLAAGLSAAAGRGVHPVSLQHAERIPPRDLDGIPADTLAPFLRRSLARGERSFLLLPLFFGPSRALSSFVPQQVEGIEAAFGPVALQLAPTLCPLPGGEPRLTSILLEQATAAAGDIPLRRVILVDHGSPEPRVTAVRHYLAGQMQSRLGSGTELRQAVMERRRGTDYDFNGERLERVLLQAAETDEATPIILSLLFLSPGRHAGPGGDIETICESVRRRHPALRILTSGLVGEHPDLIDILQERLRQGLKLAKGGAEGEGAA